MRGGWKAHTVNHMARFFIALPVPPKVSPVVLAATKEYPQYLKSIVPPDHWHVTLLNMGEIGNHREYLSRLTKPLVQTYVPTINLTHVGRGFHRLHLWSWATPTPVVLNIRQMLMERLKKMRFRFPRDETESEFSPHIHVGNLWPNSRQLGLADHQAQISFTATQAHIYRRISTPEGIRYNIEGTISLTS